ncbi:hypothetical protein V5D56_05085 [Cellulosimicrobium sp. PMB13]|uniref:hypothetical protein n=1 Tax=Cellulosimicrobium sp. PMB13 TaxID=3120158 RepID=UPI003F4C3CD2
MLSPVAGPLRVTRAALVATLVLALGAAAHAVGGGQLPDPLVLAALAAFTLAGTMAAARARFTVPRLVGLLGAGQLGLHVALDALGHGAVACVPGGHTGHGGGLVCSPGAVVPDAAAGVASSAHLASSAGSGVPGVWMLVAHAVATLVLAVVLAHGERALERFVAWLTPRASLLAPAVVAPSRREAGVPAGFARRPSARHPGTAPTRGPPAVVRLVGTSA